MSPRHKLITTLLRLGGVIAIDPKARREWQRVLEQRERDRQRREWDELRRRWCGEDGDDWRGW